MAAAYVFIKFMLTKFNYSSNYVNSFVPWILSIVFKSSNYLIRLLRFKLFYISVTIDPTNYLIYYIFYLIVANYVLKSPSNLINRFSISYNASFSSILFSLSLILIDFNNEHPGFFINFNKQHNIHLASK